MCGIVGVLQHKSEVPRPIRQKALQILFSDALLETETRGEDATGLYQVHADGDWALTKKGIKVSEWLWLNGEGNEDPVVYSDFMDSWMEHPQELTALVGHCRKATIGSKGENNEDNHPFSVQLDEDHTILGVHNGTLKNHETIFRKLPDMLTRQGTVDSEAIFHLLFHLSEHGTKPFDGKMLEALGHRLDGAFACVAVNTRFPNIVATFREGRPLDYVLIAPLNIVVVASEKKYVLGAVEKYEFFRKIQPFLKDGSSLPLPEIEVYDLMLMDRDYRIFDTEKEFLPGKPCMRDMDKISVKGEMRRHSESILEDWKLPSTTTSSSTSSSSGTGTGTTGTAGAGAKDHSEENRKGSRVMGPTHHVAKTSKVPGAASPGENVKAIPASTGSGSEGDDDTPLVVEVEIGSEAEAKRALDRAKALGLCTSYGHLREVARNIGVDASAATNMDALPLANLVAQTHFNMGYAIARTDSAAELKKWRDSGAGQTKKLEQARTKRDRAQKHIWERTHIITVMLSLAEQKCPITLQNMRIVIRDFPDISEEDQIRLEAVAVSIFEDKSVHSSVRRLGGRIRLALTRRKGKLKRQGAAGAD